MKSETFKIAMIRKLSLQISMEVVLFLILFKSKTNTPAVSYSWQSKPLHLAHPSLPIQQRGGGGAINQIPHSRCSAPQVQEDSVHFLTLIF